MKNYVSLSMIAAVALAASACSKSDEVDANASANEVAPVEEAIDAGNAAVPSIENAANAGDASAADENTAGASELNSSNAN